MREDLSYNVRDITNVGLTDQIFEGASVVVSFNNINVNVSCLYRSPDANFESFMGSLEKLLTKTFKSKSPQFICGDFSCNFLSKNQNTYDLLNLLTSFGYSSCFAEYSRVQKDLKTLIDNVFSTNDTNSMLPKTIGNIISDHNAQLLYFKLLQIENSIDNIRKRDFSNVSEVSQNCGSTQARNKKVIDTLHKKARISAVK